jgi:transcriptional regulator with XRE-family HTH domain
MPQYGHIYLKTTPVTVYGQDGQVPLLCSAFMKNKELDMLIGFNLRKLRRECKLTQEQLAERLRVSSGLIPKWESGAKGIGKHVLLKLCDVFNVRPYVFCMDEKMPYITNSREQEIVYKIREAERLGVHDQIEQYCEFIVGQAKKKKSAASKGRPTSTETANARRNGNLLP